MWIFLVYLGKSDKKGHSWRRFYRIVRQRIRWGCDRGADEMLGVDDDDDEGADDKRWRCEDDEMI